MAHDHDPTPAIVRTFSDADREAEVMGTLHDSVSHTRGWGDSGYRIQTVKMDCPADQCAFDRMVRRVDVGPESPTEVRYWCLNPNCAHYVSDSVSYACHGSYPQRVIREPAVWESIHG